MSKNLADKERAFFDKKAETEKAFDIKEKVQLIREIHETDAWWRDFIPQFSNKRVLDIGCGTGRTLAYCELFQNDGVGLDISRGELKRAIQKHHLINLNGKFVNSTVKSLPFADNTFDIIHMRWVIHHLSKDELKESMAEMSRVLKNGGLVLLYETNYLYPFRLIVQTSLLKKVNIFRRLALWRGLLDPDEKALACYEYIRLIEETRFRILIADYQTGLLYYLPGLFLSDNALRQAITKLDKTISPEIPENFCTNILLIAKKN